MKQIFGAVVQRLQNTRRCGQAKRSGGGSSSIVSYAEKNRTSQTADIDVFKR